MGGQGGKGFSRNPRGGASSGVGGQGGKGFSSNHVGGASSNVGGQGGERSSSNAGGGPAKGIASFFVKQAVGRKRVRPAEISDEEDVVVISD